MKKSLFLAVAILFCATASAGAEGTVKEVSFQRDCAQGVPLYDSASGKIACGQLAQSGVGYVVEMAMRGAVTPSCPSGYDYIGNLDKGSLISRGITPDSALQYFACAKKA